MRVDEKHCKRMASLYKHMGNTLGAITLILRSESKFFQVKVLVFFCFFFILRAHIKIAVAIRPVPDGIIIRYSSGRSRANVFYVRVRRRYTNTHNKYST